MNGRKHYISLKQWFFGTMPAIMTIKALTNREKTFTATGNKGGTNPMTIFLSSMLTLSLITLGAQFIAYNAYMSKKGRREPSHGSRVHTAMAAN